MEKMRKKIVVIGLLFITHLLVLFCGLFFGGKVSDAYIHQKFENVNAEIHLAHYVLFRDFSKSLKSGQLDKPKCSADLGASSNFDTIKSCLKNEQCRILIADQVAAQAPEINENGSLPFTYLPVKEGRRYCQS